MGTKIKLLNIWLLMLCLVCSAESYARKRVALVIGNSDYQEQSLRNPINDAKDISKALQGLGFEVDLRLNTRQEEMENAVQRFGKRLQGNTVGLFYYSGHGVQYDGSNYIIPIGAMSRVSAPDHLRYKTVDAGYVLGVMKQAGNGLNIVVLDACRNNPFKSFSRSLHKGLKRIPGAEGTIIAYSTSPGKVALDGSGRNSPYTAQLIEKMKKPNLPVEIMLKQVRKSVKLETGGKQSPWYEASIDGDFYFAKRTGVINNSIVDSGVLGNSSKLDTSVSVSISGALGGLKGRRIWITNGTDSECNKMEKLGLTVDCEKTRKTSKGKKDIIIRCEEIPHEAAKEILHYLDLSPDEYKIKTHRNSKVDNSECGELFEITLRH